MRRCSIRVSSRLAMIEAFVSLRGGACQSETQVGDLIATEPDGSPTSNMPERASRMECTKSCVAAVLSVRGKNCKGWIRGTRRVPSVRYSACILAVNSRSKAVGEAVFGE